MVQHCRRDASCQARTRTHFPSAVPVTAQVNLAGDPVGSYRHRAYLERYLEVSQGLPHSRTGPCK